MKYEVLVTTRVTALVTVEAEDEEKARELALRHARERIETARATYDDWEIGSDPAPVSPGR